MTDALTRVLQDLTRRPQVRIVRVTITSSDPLTVTLPDGARIRGTAIRGGLVYEFDRPAIAVLLEPSPPLVFPTE
jgi:hypothetical protein